MSVFQFLTNARNWIFSVCISLPVLFHPFNIFKSVFSICVLLFCFPYFYLKNIRLFYKLLFLILCLGRSTLNIHARSNLLFSPFSIKMSFKLGFLNWIESIRIFPDEVKYFSQLFDDLKTTAFPRIHFKSKKFKSRNFNLTIAPYLLNRVNFKSEKKVET